MKISLIAALSENRVIGKDNKLPWNIQEDLKHFRSITKGHPVIMGRKTFESIGRPLSGRANIVVTRNSTYTKKGIAVRHSLEKAVAYAKTLDQKEVFIIGGAALYHEAIAMADKLYLTIIDKEYDVDSWFPKYKEKFLLKESKKSKVGGLTLTYSMLVSQSFTDIP